MGAFRTLLTSRQQIQRQQVPPGFTNPRQSQTHTHFPSAIHLSTRRPTGKATKRHTGLKGSCASLASRRFQRPRHRSISAGSAIMHFHTSLPGEHLLNCTIAQDRGKVFTTLSELKGHQDQERQAKRGHIDLAYDYVYLEATWHHQCGFCACFISTWHSRVAHVADHYEKGEKIESWELL